MTRLDSLSPELVGKFLGASQSKKYAAISAACEIAVAEAEIEAPIITDALTALKSGLPFEPQQKAALSRLTTQLDEAYFKLQEADAGNSEGIERAFSRARAVAALTVAAEGMGDSLVEAIYDAAFATSRPEKLFDLIASML